ncbi:MAG TPA: hypothetical protein VLW54_00835 [Candidatus Acidoferrales bacterium]|nr:hypothetical protein [Candidatus Acidoferrales bacterium]
MPASQTKRTVWLAALAIAATALLLAVLLRAAPVAQAAQAAPGATAPAQTSSNSSAERWLHVAVDCKNENGERVRVNLPISLARTVLASIQKGKLDHGIVHVENARMNDVDVRALLKAVKAAQDGEYVTVEGKDTNVRVRKQGNMFLIHVEDKTGKHIKLDRHHESSGPENVDIRVPIEVADALFSGAPDELNVGAALDLLSRHDHLELVSVQDSENNVRVWIDTKTTQD